MPRLDAPPASVTRSSAHADQRRRILRAVGELVAERGYSDVTVELIVKRAHVSFKTFYKHFASKEECFVALFEAAFATDRESHPRAPRRRARAMVRPGRPRPPHPDRADRRGSGHRPRGHRRVPDRRARDHRALRAGHQGLRASAPRRPRAQPPRRRASRDDRGHPRRRGLLVRLRAPHRRRGRRARRLPAGPARADPPHLPRPRRGRAHRPRRGLASGSPEPALRLIAFGRRRPG